MTLVGRLASALTALISTRELRWYERLILNAWRDTLPPGKQSILDTQLQAVKFVQRQAGDAKVVFYYGRSPGGLTFTNVKPNLHAATVVLRPFHGTAMQFLRVKIFVHRGRFFSLEFPKRPGRYLELHHMEMDTLHADAVEEQCSLD